MKILLAVNGSNESYGAVEEVAGRPWPNGSQVKLLFVIEPPAVSMDEIRSPLDDFYVRLEKAARDYAIAVVNNAEEKLSQWTEGIYEVTTDTLTGHPKFVILREAEQWNADLIVLGASDVKGMKYPWLGSTAYAVVLHARCSVELVRRRPELTEREPLRILLAVDGSLLSENAVSEVAQRVWPQGSDVRVISVAEPPELVTPSHGSLPQLLLDELEHYAWNRSQAAVERAAARLRYSQTGNVIIATEVISGSPKEVIIDQAETWKADLIVVGSHGFRGDRRFRIGSVSQAVAAQAACSVEIVRTRIH
jgi:nucleotide-binding universal stress UspA family protein